MLCEVMDKMPTLESEWTFAAIAGLIAFLAARFIPFGWVLGAFCVFYQYKSDWFVGSVAQSAMREDPHTTRLAQVAIFVPIVCTVVGLSLRIVSRKDRLRGDAVTRGGAPG